MLSSRASSSLRRASARVPRMASLQARSMSSSVYNEGAVAQSKEFSKKERAHEDQYVKQHEMNQLKKLRNEIEKKKLELASLEKEHAETLEKASGVSFAKEE